jgi:hypothetical protein
MITAKEMAELRDKVWKVISKPDGISMNQHIKAMRTTRNTFVAFLDGIRIPHRHTIYKIKDYLSRLEAQ